MEEVIYLNSLYDYYKDLLTSKQRDYFEDYYQNDLSLSEMAVSYGVSRNAIYKQLRDVEEILNNYEVKLQLAFKFKRIVDVVKDTNNEILLKEIEGIIG